jgi:hypothetical protein
MWKGDRYYYSIKTLQTIADNYHSLYDDGLPVGVDQAVTNSWEIAEYRGDFDNALNSLGRYRWTTGRLGLFQKAVVSDITGQKLIDKDDTWAKKEAYRRMKAFLNGG